ncbi:type IV pilus assembly protein FimV [Sulfuricystis multivorans]|uniref:type IV pilus assembly protein FimV n=1 Tax=Sulfuricystis multivorans TaxID=2211108 RepID=UPI000F81E506|nr:hypothetical protein [Sulfuricystis multivorans]
MVTPGLPHYLFRNELSLRVKTTFATFALLVTGVLLPMTSQATGFGAAQGEAVIGTPLSVEIEVTNPERSSMECFEIKPLGEEGDSSFFPRRARLDLRKSADGKTHLVVTGDTIREPVVEFRLRTRCGAQVERHYTLLASPPRELLPESVALPVTSSLPIANSPRTDTVKSIPQSHGLTLNQLARQRYPLQPKARAKFKRMVKNANPDLALADDEVLPVDPAALKYPDHLPKRRTGPYRPAKAQKKVTQPSSKSAAKAKEVKTATPVAAPEPSPAQSDRLVIASGAGEKPQPTTAQEAALAGKAESSFAAQEELIARLAQAEMAYKSLQERLQLMEDRMRGLEMEKERLRQAQEALSQSALVELVIAVIAGGALGALLMSLWLRRRAANSDPPRIGF